MAFDQYEFFDGTKIIPIEGRLTTIHAIGKGASAFQVFKTYETLITGLGAESEILELTNTTLKIKFKGSDGFMPPDGNLKIITVEIIYTAK
ncbi:MAG: hypothetical protein H7Y04_07955 [Verrucomicrobia bacterium]|nr:hypothetical protein [Cytophagales bacterium]